MGTWGTGNFDNDDAHDYLLEVEDLLVNRIEEILADDDLCALDEEGEGVLMPTLEILSVLHDQCRLGLPERATIHRWKERYLSVFDEEIDGFDPEPGYKEMRRAVIEATFLKLEAQAWDNEERQQWYAGSKE